MSRCLICRQCWRCGRSHGSYAGGPWIWMGAISCSRSLTQSQTASAAVCVLANVLTEWMSDLQTVLALWQKPAATMVGGPGSGWAATAARLALALRPLLTQASAMMPLQTPKLRPLLTQASAMVPLQKPTLKHVCLCPPQPHVIPSGPKIPLLWHRLY